MKIFTVSVLLAVLYFAVSEGLNSTLQGQLTGKIVEVENDNALTLCIAHIFNEAGQKLAIGVINKDRYIATNTKALLGLRKVKIEFSDGIKKYSSCDFLFYGGHIIQIGFELPLEDDSMDDRRFARFRELGIVRKWYHDACPVAVAVGWDEETRFKKKQVLIHYEGNFRIITKPSSFETDNFVGRIGDPLFLKQQLVGILVEPENISGYATYENMGLAIHLHYELHFSG